MERLKNLKREKINFLFFLRHFILLSLSSISPLKLRAIMMIIRGRYDRV